jgi:hypothetical protein
VCRNNVVLITREQKIKNTTKRHAKNEKKDKKKCLYLNLGKRKRAILQVNLAGPLLPAEPNVIATLANIYRACACIH